MINLERWAALHGVSPGALDELRGIMTQPNTDPKRIVVGRSESSVQDMIGVEASDAGCWLLRNNVGACVDDRGRLIRYGLANDSKQMNTMLKSSDLIGIRPLMITHDMVGCIIGQFLAREVKAANWSYKGDSHELAQLRFMNRIHALGGDAQFANGVGTL